MYCITVKKEKVALTQFGYLSFLYSFSVQH